MRLEDLGPEGVDALGNALAYLEIKKVFESCPRENLSNGIKMYRNGESPASEIAYQAAKGALLGL